jgi:hypothetical protein
VEGNQKVLRSDQGAQWHWSEGNKYVIEGGKSLFWVNGAAAIGMLTQERVCAAGARPSPEPPVSWNAPAHEQPWWRLVAMLAAIAVVRAVLRGLIYLTPVSGRKISSRLPR